MTKEEFEKEAKERARKLEENQTVGVYDDDEDSARDIGWNAGEVSCYEDGFNDGAKYVNNKCNVKLTKAKELIQDLIDSLEVIDGEQIRELKVVKEAEQFLINIERYENGK